MIQESYYIGIDGGGTKTEAVVVDSHGVMLGQGNAGSTNLNHYSRTDVIFNLNEAIQQALGPRSVLNGTVSIFLGMSGVSTDDDRNNFAEIAREIASLPPGVLVGVDNDCVAALAGGLAGEPGIALVAGTGSICIGINRKGQSHWCGGWGAIADDAGSAPWVAVRALRSAVRSVDGRGESTLLTQLIFDALNIAAPRELIFRIHNQGVTRAEFGSLAPLVVQASLDGDKVASHILDDAAKELSSLVKATSQTLFNDDTCPVILVGGFARSGAPFQSMLINQITVDTPTAVVREPILRPVMGSALQALRQGGMAWTPEVIKNLSSTMNILEEKSTQ